jgi:hypothetical protein
MSSHNILHLPKELIIEILRFLNINDLVNSIMLITKQMKIIAHQVPVEYYLDNRYLTDYNVFARTFPRALSLNVTNDTSLDYMDPMLFSRTPYVKALRTLQAGPYLSKLHYMKQLVVTKLEGFDKYLTSKSLEFLKIDFCREENGTYDYDNILPNLKNLKILHVRYRHTMPNTYISTFTNLIELCLVWCCQITDDAFQSLPKLERLYLRCNENITSNIFRYLPNLKLLHFEDQIFTEEAFMYLSNLESLTLTLKHTSMNERNRMEEDWFKYMVNLKHLSITHLCSCLYDCECVKNITPNVFRLLPKLKSLYLYRCNHLITKQMFDLLPALDMLDIHVGYDEECIPYEKHIFKNLKVKHIKLDYGFRYMQRKDLKKLIENGTQTLSVVKEQYRETRFSPIFQERIILYGRDILRFFKIKRITNHTIYKDTSYVKRLQTFVNRRLEKEPYFFKL